MGDADNLVYELEEINQFLAIYNLLPGHFGKVIRMIQKLTL